MNDSATADLLAVAPVLIDDGMSLSDAAAELRKQWRRLLLVPLAAGVLAIGVSALIPPTFTATTVFMPPQQNQSAAATAVASLGALSSLVGGVAGVRTPADQYIALMQSVTVSDRIVDQFKLMTVYGKELRVDTRTALGKRVRINIGKKDGLISVEVDDGSPQRAAEMANQYVAELQRMTANLAVTEAQQRRVFFESRLAESRTKLTQAQEAMQAAGFNQGALNAEPRSAAEGYARLLAQATAAEVRLQVLRGSLAEDAPEVRQQRATLGALREQLKRSEATSQPASTGPGYIGKYREFKYQETLFELFARQYELARVDESREGPLVQVVDVAQPPERKSAPRRTLIVGGSIVATALLMSIWLLARAARPGALPDAPITSPIRGSKAEASPLSR